MHGTTRNTLSIRVTSLLISVSSSAGSRSEKGRIDVRIARRPFHQRILNSTGLITKVADMEKGRRRKDPSHFQMWCRCPVMQLFKEPRQLFYGLVFLHRAEFPYCKALKPLKQHQEKQNYRLSRRNRLINPLDITAEDVLWRTQPNTTHKIIYLY